MLEIAHKVAVKLEARDHGHERRMERLRVYGKSTEPRDTITDKSALAERREKFEAEIAAIERARFLRGAAFAFAIVVIVWLVIWFCTAAAKAALTPGHAAAYRSQSHWDCPAGLNCTNAAHLNLLRRTNNLDYIVTPGGNAGVRASAR